MMEISALGAGSPDANIPCASLCNNLKDCIQRKIYMNSYLISLVCLNRIILKYLQYEKQSLDSKY